MTEPSQYFKGRTVQEQMNEVIGYVDARAEEVAAAKADDVLEPAEQAKDAAIQAKDLAVAAQDAAEDAQSAAEQAVTDAAAVLANAVKKTGEASQSIVGDIAIANDLSAGGDLTVSGDTGVQGQLSVLGGCDLRSPVTVPTPTNNTDAAPKKYVDDALDNYAGMVRIANDQIIGGVKTVNDLIIGSTFINKSSVTQFTANTNEYHRMYRFENSSGAQYKNFVVLITPKRAQPGRTGILFFGDNRNAGPSIGWITKGTDITSTDFVITKEGTEINVWCKTFVGASDGYHGIRLTEHTTSNLASGFLEAIVNEEGYEITSSGYTDSEGVTHTFDYYVTPS